MEESFAQVSDLNETDQETKEEYIVRVWWEQEEYVPRLARYIATELTAQPDLQIVSLHVPSWLPDHA